MQAGEVRFVFRHYAFIGPESQWAAEAAECANEQGRFWDLYDKLFAEQAGENAGAFSRENLTRFADELGLDMTRFSRCLDSGRTRDVVEQETRAGWDHGVRGTPTLFVNGRLVEGGADYAELRAAIEAELSRAE